MVFLEKMVNVFVIYILLFGVTVN